MSHRQAPRPPTRSSLEHTATWYLERYGGTALALRRALWRRVREAERRDDGLEVPDREVASAWIDEIVSRCEQAGLVNDRAWADSRASSLLSRGVSSRAMRQRLRAKGISETDTRAAISALAEEDGASPDLRAAVTYVRRRGFGPWRDPEQRAARREKDLAATCRAGFPYGVARKVIDAADLEAIEVLLAGGEESR